MGIYRQILVALDRTPLSEPVFQQACALATQNQAKLLLAPLLYPAPLQPSG
jgi:nucleotide-binding universal stress UspA family protein